MNALEFVSLYDELLKQLCPVISAPAYALLLECDPHALVSPERRFSNTAEATGFMVITGLKLIKDSRRNNG